MWLPRTAVAVDHFHLVSLGNQVMTEARQNLSQQVKGRRGGGIDKAWAHRMLLLRAGDTLTGNAAHGMEEVFAADDATGRLEAVWKVKEQLRILLSRAPSLGSPPRPRDSGRFTGNHDRPRRYDGRLLRVFYLSSLSALKSCPAARTYYVRKRGEEKTRIQALLFLALRRLDVVWDMLRDGTIYTPRSASAGQLAA